MFGTYFTQLYTKEIQKFSQAVKFNLGDLRGCDPEMILKFIVGKHGFKMRTVNQDFMLFQQSADARLNNVATCFHKHCHSKSGEVPDRGI